MRLFFIALIVVSSVCPSVTWRQHPSESSAVPFHISSRGTAFGMQGTFDGEYRVYPNSIEITVTNATIYISEKCPYQGRREVATIKFGLATGIAEKRWKTASRSESFAVGRVMSPGEEHTLTSLHFSIPKETSTDLSKHWFVVELEDVILDLGEEEKRRTGYSYAHSDRSIFSQPQGEAAKRKQDN